MPRALHVSPAIRGGCEAGWRERVLAELAARQYGVVARGQLLAGGLAAGAIERRVAAGRLQPVYRGVYAVGHPTLTVEGRWLAAVLAAGAGAVLSHRSAAGLWDIGASGRIEVTAPRHRRPRERLIVHWEALAADEVTEERRIPVTTVARTILDLAAVLPKDRLAKAIHEAEVRRLFDARVLRALLDRHRRRPGTANLRALLDDRDAGSRLTRSELEDRFSAFVARHELPPPRRNHLVDGYECDAVWPAQRLIVELDGHAAHHTHRAFERDRHRDRVLQARGWRVVRLTWRQLDGAAATDLAALLGGAEPRRPSARPSPRAPRRRSSG